jgi:uncharacterized tellurite resistance protein B-like protein
MFFGNGLNAPLFELMATHPPLDQRIHAIDPTWDGKFPPLKPEQIETVKRAARNELKPSPLPGLFQNIGVTLAGAGAIENERTPPVIRSQTVVPNVGKLTPLHLKYAVALRDTIPENLKSAARDPLGAAALIYALLVSADGPVRANQILEIGKRFSPDVSEKTAALFPDVTQTAARARLPLVNLALGALRNLDANQFAPFSETLKWLIASDGKIELFEFILQKIILRHLAAKFAPKNPATIQFYSIKPLVPDCAVILSALARLGSDAAPEMQTAFAQGAPYLRAPNSVELNLLTSENCGVNEMDSALTRLAQAAPIIKKNLLEACVRVVGADGLIRENEAELLRAISDALDCPMPPLLAES